MVTLLAAGWARIRDSLWFLPGLLTLAAIGLAFGLVAIDNALEAEQRAAVAFAFGGGTDGAREVLSAIAGSMMTVTGVVFSITIVALQLASSQFSPRVLRSFSTDRVNQVVLGVFIGTFTYCLLVLRTIRAADAAGDQFVPTIAVGVAIVLAIISVGFLIFYIHHIARSIRVAVMIDRAARDTGVFIDRFYPECFENSPARSPAADLPEPGERAVMTAAQSGYLQLVDTDALCDLATRERCTVWIEPNTGDFVLRGEPLVSVWPPTALSGEVNDQVRRAFVLGAERSLEGDIEFGLRQIADIAIKALSPGVNDPTTAMNCIDRLADLLVQLGNRRLAAPPQRDAAGEVRVITRDAAFSRVVDLSFDQIRHYGATAPLVLLHLLAVLGRIGALVPSERHAPLTRQIWTILQSTEETLPLAAERSRLEPAGQEALAHIGRRRTEDLARREQPEA